MLKTVNNNQGLTLLELVIVISLFSAIILAISLVFVKANDIQRRTAIEHDLQGGLAYGLGFLFSDVQQAQVRTVDDCDCIGCGDSTGKYFVTETPPNNKILYFKDKDNLCTQYYLTGAVEQQILTINRGGLISELTANDIDIADINFDVSPSGNRFTIMITAQKSDKSLYLIQYQTSVTATNYTD